MNNYAIEIENLSKSFEKVEAVKNISFTVNKGELFCFLGPNGAGKTTTIKMLCGLVRPDYGNMKLLSYSWQDDPEKIRSIIGYIPDTPYLYERLTVSEFFDFIGEPSHIPRNKVAEEKAEKFQLFALKDYANTLIRDLSHGYRQRLIYVSTFLHNPKIIFIDEPFVGLDPYTIRLIQNLLKEKTKEGVTIFLTSHILALVEQLADRIGIIYEGKLVAIGTIAELRSQIKGAQKLEDIFFSLTGS